MPAPITETAKMEKTSNEIRNKRAFSEHINNAKVLYSKGLYSEASKEVSEALLLRPDNADAREIAADILAALGKKQAAAAEYKKLFTEDASRESAEEKYALIILNQYDEAQKEKELLEHKEEKKTTGMTVILTAIVPGVGAMLKEQYVKGGIIFVLWLILFCLTVKGVKATPNNPSAMFFSTPAVLADIVWLYSFVDTIISYTKKTK